MLLLRTSHLKKGPLWPAVHDEHLSAIKFPQNNMVKLQMDEIRILSIKIKRDEMHKLLPYKVMVNK